MRSIPRTTLDRYTQIGDLAVSVRWVLDKTLWPFMVILAGIAAFLGFTQRPGALAFGLIALGTVLVLAVWRKTGIGLPIIPVLALQHLVAYGLPIVIGHKVLTQYPERFTTLAGLEVLIFDCGLAAVWRFGMQLFQPASAMSYALQGFSHQGSEKLRRLGFGLVIAATGYELLQSMDLLGPLFAMLPSGTSSLVMALVAAVSACGFFLVSMFEGTRTLSTASRIFFWGMLLLNCFLSAASYLLSPMTTVVVSVLIGLFWSSGRLPWRYLTAVMLVLSFLNVGKYTMRDRYWYQSDYDPQPQLKLAQMPASYAEWFQASYDIITGQEERTGGLVGQKARAKGMSIFERVNNLQNLLYVIDAMETWSIAPLGGRTYTLIPPLLLPRIIWPEKPRTHEGQIMLNVHFGRQDLGSTFQTYVAWGLLPEAYGNFGPIAGAISLSFGLGIFFAWLEKLTAKKLLLSLEGLISFTVLLAMANSYEMVASVLVTSLFQAVGVLVLASTPFIERTTLKRPSPS
jgi:hypothetical protein